MNQPLAKAGCDTPDPAFSPRRVWALAAVLFLATAAVFWKSAALGFVQWDDDINIYNNPHLRVLDGAQVWWMFTDTSYARRYLPLGWLGWALNQHWFGLAPWSYHVGNILLHATNAVLVFFLVGKLLWLGAGTWWRRQPAGVWVGAALASLLWAVHPLQVESVAWASARIYSQAALFLLVSLLCHVQFLSLPQGARGRWLWFSASVGGFACSLLTYPIALGALALYFILDVVPFARAGQPGQAGWGWLRPALWLEKVPFLAVAFLVLGATVWSRFHSGIYQPPVGVDAFGFGSRWMQALYVWGYYVWKPWVPTGLSPVYPTLIRFEPLDWPFLCSAAGVGGVSLGLWLMRRRWPGALAVWIGYVAVLAPLVGWTEHPHFASDRYSYLAGVAWVFALAGGIWWLYCADAQSQPVPQAEGSNPRSRGWMILPLGSAVALLLGGMTQKQISIWEDSVVLHRHIIEGLEGHPYRHKLWLVLGTIYQDRGEAANAELSFREVLAIAPDNADAHSNLADVLIDKDQFEEARGHYLEAIRIRPGHANARQNLGIALAGRERFDEAAAQFRELLRYNPDNALAHHNLGLTLAKLGQLDEARQHRDEARRLQTQRVTQQH